MQCRVDEGALAHKHELMAESAFRFLRATYFRWARKIEALCPELAQAPRVLCVGDAHTENFGTWRDSEGRLVWGVNDFDEAAVMPYPFDLVRLMTSFRLAPKTTVKNREAADAILEGYRAGLRNPRPTLLDEQELWMRDHVGCSDEERRSFWDKIADCREVPADPGLLAGFAASFPDGEAKIFRYATRIAGGGSLGRPRFVVTARWRGGCIVREAKALTPSAWDWAHGESGGPNHFLDLARGSYRAPDPFLTVAGAFIFRRLAADSRKIELRDIDGAGLPARLLRAMGFDLGSIHAAHEGAADIPRHLDALPRDWLPAAAKTAAAQVEQEHAEWKSRR
ncbi:hypothetical protein A8B73_20490 [Methylosinus sp. 3S-1]|nr:hypothetical protein A8B73_20490 [Methylosinus sp. 3S-1]